MTVAPASPSAAAMPRPAPRVAPATRAIRPRSALPSATTRNRVARSPFAGSAGGTDRIPQFRCRIPGEGPDAQLVDQVMPEQRVDEPRAAGDLDLGPVPALERRDAFGDVAADQVGIVPVQLVERRRGRAGPHFAPRCSIAAAMRQPNAAVDVTVRTRFHADHLASPKWRRTWARSPMRAGSPAALSPSLSGTLTAMVMTTAVRYKANAAPIHGSRLRLSALKWSAAARPVSTRAPRKAAMNHRFMMALSIDWNAPTKVRSSVCRSPGMIVCVYRPNTPAIRPVVRMAAANTVPGRSCVPLAATEAASGGEYVVMSCPSQVRAAITASWVMAAAG